MEYAFAHEGKGFMPSGGMPIAAEDVPAHNRELEAREIAWLRTAPQSLFLYVKHPLHTTKYDADLRASDLFACEITTWLGTVVSESARMGMRARVGFGFHTYRRSIDCRIFGTRYVGWYMESSGNYCRLQKAKRQ